MLVIFGRYGEESKQDERVVLQIPGVRLPTADPALMAPYPSRMFPRRDPEALLTVTSSSLQRSRGYGPHSSEAPDEAAPDGWLRADKPSPGQSLIPCEIESPALRKQTDILENCVPQPVSASAPHC